ncbi:hypothetical protein [Timonella senegalensis]
MNGHTTGTQNTATQKNSTMKGATGFGARILLDLAGRFAKN